MQIGLINTYSTDNVGDAAIYAAIDQMMPKGWTNLGAVHSWTSPLNWSPRRNAASADAFISVGGDIFNNARPNTATRAFLGHLNALYRCAPRAILFGQSIPRSCRGMSALALAAVLRRVVSVTVRDRRSTQFLARFGVPAARSIDLAFALRGRLEYETAAADLFSQCEIDPDRSVVLSTRSLGRLYASCDHALTAKLVELCRRLTARGHQLAVLRQSMVDDNDADGAVIFQLKRYVPSLKVIDLFSPVSSLAPWQLLIGVLAISNAVVGVRFHTNVLRMVSGRASYNLYYSDKGQELTECWNIPGSAVASFEVDSVVREIERSASSTFDDVAARYTVNQAFQQALSGLSDAAQVQAEWA